MGLDLTIVAATLIFAILGERLTRRRHVHRLLWTTCGHRTNTSYQSRFERLQRFWTPMRSAVRPPNENDVVTFDQSEARNGSLIIEIPPKSGWYTLHHTHTQSDGCSDINTLSGCWFVGSTTWANPWSAPAWVHRFEERMRIVKSRAISGFTYWLSRNVLGMRIRYEEYVPIWANDADQK